MGTSSETASIVWDTDYQWKDKTWLKKRAKINALDQPMSVYELHLGSWQRDPSEPKRVLTYKEIATSLVPYMLRNGLYPRGADAYHGVSVITHPGDIRLLDILQQAPGMAHHRI